MDRINNMKMCFLVILCALLSLSTANSISKTNLTLQDRVIILERRVDSLEAPSWRVTNRGLSNWEFCSESGPCKCAYLRRALDCWDKIETVGIPPQMRVPRDVKTIDISKNDIPALSSSLFLGMNRLIDLSAYDIGLESLPTYVFYPLWKLVHLKLGSNKLKVLPDEVFSTLPKLQTLDLSMNELSYLPRGVFSSNTALTQLEMSHNKLKSLPEGLLISHNNLTLLDVSNNEIEDLEGALGNLVSLETLVLDRNNIGELSWLIAECCPNLKSFSASHNRIVSIGDKLTALPRLQDVNLANNNIKTLSVSSLPPAVMTVDFSRNEINKLDLSSSAKLSLLENLHLSGNLLESFSAAVLLSTCSALKTIDLSNNIIGEANIAGIGENVETILLNGNLLDFMAEFELSGAKELTTLDLHNNLWECNCKLAPFIRSLSSAKKLAQSTTLSSPCYGPEAMEDKTLAQVINMC